MHARTHARWLGEHAADQSALSQSFKSQEQLRAQLGEAQRESDLLQSKLAAANNTIAHQSAQVPRVFFGSPSSNCILPLDLFLPSSNAIMPTEFPVP